MLTVGRAAPSRSAGFASRIPSPRQPRPKDSDRRFPYSWNPKYPARVGVIPRKGGNADVGWFDVEPRYVFHPMNAYDEGDTIILYVVRHPKMFDNDHLGPNEGHPHSTAGPSISPTQGAESRFDDRDQEFPRIDERLIGKQHRYGYAPAVWEGTGADALLKHDFVASST
jgi:carotenoid cleavage oxygenase